MGAKCVVKNSKRFGKPVRPADYAQPGVTWRAIQGQVRKRLEGAQFGSGTQLVLNLPLRL